MNGPYVNKMFNRDAPPLCTVVRVGFDDCESPAPQSVSSPTLRRFYNNLLSMPKSAVDLWNPGVYSSFDERDQAHGTAPLERTLTLGSDSGHESMASEFTDEESSIASKLSESSEPKIATKAVTIYELEKRKNAQRLDNSSASSTNSSVVKIFIPPEVRRNVEEHIIRARQQEPGKGNMALYGTDVRKPAYSVSAYEPRTLPGRLDGSAVFEPAAAPRRPLTQNPQSQGGEVSIPRRSFSRISFPQRTSPTYSQGSERFRAGSLNSRTLSDVSSDFGTTPSPVLISVGDDESAKENSVQVSGQRAATHTTRIDLNPGSRASRASTSPTPPLNWRPTALKHLNRPISPMYQNVGVDYRLPPRPHQVGPLDSPISSVSFKFYDRHMNEQDSLSKRVSVQLLKKSALRASMPRGRQRPWQPEIAKLLKAHKRVRWCSVDPKRDSPHEKVITVQGKQKCALCHFILGRGQAMTIESLNLFYHMHCFRCADCARSLLVGLADIRGTDVHVNGDRLQCRPCFEGVRPPA